jgi:AhpD family alkylhydroperoxidase
MNPYATDEKAMAPLMALEAQFAASSLGQDLIDLVKTRASQINGCAYCLHMHTAAARQEGETEARLYLLNAWRESELYTPRERAALAWTEALTLIADTHAPDADYEEAMAHFSKQEMVDLTLLIGTINSWNRLAISFRLRHPNDKPAKAAA